MYQTAGCELNLAQLPAGFGVASLSNFDPKIKRMANIEEAVSVQHEVMSGVSVTAGWYHRDYRTCAAATTRCRPLRTTRSSPSTAQSTARPSPTTT